MLLFYGSSGLRYDSPTEDYMAITSINNMLLNVMPEIEIRVSSPVNIIKSVEDVVGSILAWVGKRIQLIPEQAASPAAKSYNIDTIELYKLQYQQSCLFTNLLLMLQRKCSRKKEWSMDHRRAFQKNAVFRLHRGSPAGRHHAITVWARAGLLQGGALMVLVAASSIPVVFGGLFQRAMAIQGQRSLKVVSSWTSVIDACSQNGKDMEALDVFKEMQTFGVKRNSTTIPTSLWKHCSIDAWEGS
ncbi:hypothetical protein RHSIM_Rhsim12G0010000 [Rhododendron simsii]|uniref:Pentatricopeptide repeat-containing protein n=1 Tax=Rhododendron simsii TaxID=118357 RepID=A0A834L7X9_RHOSS|nr:hypothetical protein RHSIM_Rhsim12G0010000 [Rhododendron simsii]